MPAPAPSEPPGATPLGVIPSADEDSDLELVAALRMGDISALGLLFERHREMAIHCAERIVDPVTAEDVVAESFIRLYRSTSQGGGPTDSVRTYLLSIVRNLAIDTLRRRRDILMDTSDPAFLALAEQTHPPDDAGEEGEVSAKAALAGLPERWKTVLWALEVEGHSRHHVGELLGLNPLAVSALASRARKGLRRSYLALRLPGCSRERPAAPSARPLRTPGPRGDTLNRK